MDLTPYVAALRDDLTAAAAVGDEATARAGTALAAALEPAARLALMNALSDLAAEVSDQLDDRSVSLRLQGREVRVALDGAGEAPGFFAGPSASPFPGPGTGTGFHPGRSERAGAEGPDVGDISRMTLRMVDQIKDQAERAAAAQGMSLNSWVSQAVQGALRGNPLWARGWAEPGWPGQGWSEQGPDDRPDDGGPGEGNDRRPG